MPNELERDHGTLEYDPGETVELSLPRSHYYERLNLVGDYTVTTGTSAAQNGNGILDLIDRIEVEYNGSTTLKSLDFAMSHFGDLYDRGTRPLHDPVDFSSASTQSGSVQSFVPFLLNPGQYGAMMPSFAFSDLDLRIKWGTPSSVGDDITVDSAEVAVQSRERKRGTVADPPKVTTEEIVKNLLGFKERQRTVPLTYDGVKDVDVPRGNTMYSVLVQVLDGDAPSNGLVNRLELLENGVETHKDSTMSLFRAQDKQQYGVESLPEGVVNLNYGFRGDTDDVVDTRTMDDYELHLDTDGTQPTDPAEARIVTREIVQ